MNASAAAREPAVDLASGLAALGLTLPPGTQERLLAYAALIGRWNRVYNLTAIRDPAQVVTHHLLDCLAVLPHVAGPRVLDIGAGAGLPGLVLAMAQPAWAVTLLDSNHKKATFLRQAAIELALSNVEVVCARVEDFHPGACFDLVIARAYAALKEFVAAAQPLLAPGGTLAAMKGVFPQAELLALPPTVQRHGEIPLSVPGLGAQRHLILLQAA